MVSRSSWLLLVIGVPLAVLLTRATRFAVYLSGSASMRDLADRVGFNGAVSSTVFYLAVILLVAKTISCRRQMSAFELPVIKEATYEYVTEPIAAMWLRRIGDLADSEKRLILIARLQMVLEKTLTAQNSLEVSDVARDHSTIATEAGMADFALIRALLAAIPMVGFIGTVQGIGEALASFRTVSVRLAANVQGHGTPTELVASLTASSQSLGYAFSATLVALVLSVALVGLLALVQRYHDHLLVRLDEYCLSQTVARIQIEPQETRRLTELADRLDQFLDRGMRP